MPTNGIADGILYSVNGAPAFTYGMITLTAVVLAYVTFIEAPDIPNENPLEVNPIAETIPPVGFEPAIPEIPSISTPNEGEPSAEPATEPESDAAQEEPSADPSAEPAKEPESDVAQAEPSAEPATEPAAEPAKEPESVVAQAEPTSGEKKQGGKKTRGNHKKAPKKRKTIRSR